jgi:site-specific DNA-adenine methylase
MKLRAPYPWFGGKSSVASLVWQRFGRVRNFVEPFFGSGAILLARSRPFEGSETINDADCMVSNFWRALQADAEAVAQWADWPVNEADLHARHLWLVTQKATTNFAERMRTDPDFYDAKIAGWWVWGLCKWIGTGWCHHPEWQQLPHLGDAGMGIDRPTQQLPHLGDAGRGIDRPSQKRPHLGDAGRGIDRPSQQLPHLGNAGRGEIYDYFADLADRLRRVRVCCGDWSRVMGPTPTVKQGLTAVFLDPPYSGESGRDTDLYASECLKVAHDVRAWCEEWGHDKRLRIALCGYEGEHEALENQGWTCEWWKARGGYSSQAEESNGNAARERLWFSPHCINARLPLFAGLEV